jgi:hypothetical protein
MAFTALATMKLAYNILAQYGTDRTTLSSGDDTLALEFLNGIALELENDGGFLWKRTVGYLFVEQDTLTYSLSSSGAHCTESYVTAVTSANAASGATTLTFTSTTGMLNGDHILIDLGDGTYHKTTINGAPTSTVVTITTALTAAVSSGARVFVYTTKISAPVRVYESGIRRYTSSTGDFTDRGHEHIRSHDDYMIDFTNKTRQNTCNGIAYLEGTSSGTVYVFGTRPTSTPEIVFFTYQKPLTSAATSASNMDFPDRWKLYLAFKLALMMAPVHELPLEASQQILATATSLYGRAFTGNSETAPFIPMVNNQRNP